MEVGFLPSGDPGVFRSLLLPEAAEALTAGEPLTALALTHEEQAVGAVAGYVEDGHFLIRSLYVSPEARRKGGGRLLMDTLKKICAPYVGGMEVQFTSTREEHGTLPPFLAAMGFAELPDNGENLFLTTLDQAASSPFFSGAEKKAGTPLSTLSPGALSLLEKAANTMGSPWPEEGVFGPGVDREVSRVVMEGSEPKAYLIFDRSCLNALTLAAAWSGDPNPAVLPSLLRAAVAQAREKYPGETPVAVQAVNPAAAGLVAALLPGARPVSHSYLYQFPWF